MTLQGLLSVASLVGVELAMIAIVWGVVYLVIRRLERLIARRNVRFTDPGRRLRLHVRKLLFRTAAAVSVVAIAFNVWLMARGDDPWHYTFALVGAIGPDAWTRFAVTVAKLSASALGVLITVRVVRRVLRSIEAGMARRDAHSAATVNLRDAFVGLDTLIVHAGWLLLAVVAFRLLSVPENLAAWLLAIVRAYLVIEIGLLVIRSSVVIVDTLDVLARRRVDGRNWQRYYDHVRALLPTFRACVEYALWIAVASLALTQLARIQNILIWGPRFIQAIGLFFVGRVVIELGHFEIGRRMLPQEGLDEMTRRRRVTTAPLVRNAFTYAVYFATAVSILAALGFNPMPFLAGAGILGLVVGFGAQALINDVVSGFFILFENTYLVGDAIEAAGAKGIVEAIEFRTTRVRDADGRLHVIRNGDVKQVVNYSKDYALAVVAVDVAYDTDLPTRVRDPAGGWGARAQREPRAARRPPD